MTDESQITAAEAMRRADRLARGLNPDKRPATAHEIARARAVKNQATPGTTEYAMREERLAEIEDRRPSYRQSQ